MLTRDNLSILMMHPEIELMWKISTHNYNREKLSELEFNINLSM